MAHDATKVVMGGTVSSIKDVRSATGSAAAGNVVHKKADGSLEAVQTSGILAGISMGKDLSNAGKISYCERGNGVPALLVSGFSATQGNAVWYNPANGKLNASSGSAVQLNAVYASGPLTALLEDGTSVAAGAALIDFNCSL